MEPPREVKKKTKAKTTEKTVVAQQLPELPSLIQHRGKQGSSLSILAHPPEEAQVKEKRLMGGESSSGAAGHERRASTVARSTRIEGFSPRSDKSFVGT